MIVQESQTIQLEYYTEGPVMDHRGNIYCTTLTGGSILKIERNGKYTLWGRSACPNGQVILANGDHLVCDSELATIVRYSSEGALLRREIQQKCNGQKIFVPNDLIADKKEGIYFTDSIRHEGKIFYKSNDGKEYVVGTGFDYPNGLVLSSDEKTLFIAESYRNRILAIELKSPGVAIGEIKVLSGLPVHSSGQAQSNLPDGLAIDNHDQIWVAHYGMQAIQIINRNGELVDSIEMPFALVSNVFLSITDPLEVIVTGGYGEPGPGAICRLTLKK